MQQGPSVCAGAGRLPTSSNAPQESDGCVTRSVCHTFYVSHVLCVRCFGPCVLHIICSACHVFCMSYVLHIICSARHMFCTSCVLHVICSACHVFYVQMFFVLDVSVCQMFSECQMCCVTWSVLDGLHVRCSVLHVLCVTCSACQMFCVLCSACVGCSSPHPAPHLGSAVSGLSPDSHPLAPGVRTGAGLTLVSRALRWAGLGGRRFVSSKSIRF